MILLAAMALMAGGGWHAPQALEHSDAKATRKVYTALQPARANDANAARNIAYGADSRQRFDIWPARKAKAPILLFVPGGGFVGGSRGGPGSVFYDNVMQWANRRGFAGVAMDYRLAPTHRYPAAQHDIAAVVAWIRAYVARLNGAPERILLVGHSAGAAHVAAFLADHTDAAIAGAVLISGQYDLDARDHLYFGSQPDRFTLARLAAIRTPLLLADAEHDLPAVRGQLERFATALCARGHCPQTVHLPAHNHFSPTYSIGTQDKRLSERIARFVRSVAPHR